jgi:hypothetical protein
VIYRKSLVQIKIRVRKDLLTKIRRAAQKNDRPVTEEVAALLEGAFDHQDWQQERENWIVAIRAALEAHPGASEEALLKLKEIDDQVELEAGKALQRDTRRGDG